MLISTLNCPRLGLEVGVGDQLQGTGVHHRRVPRLVGQVELDLEPDRSPSRIELGLAKHAREHVEAALDLLAIALAIVAAESGDGDLLAHGAPAGPAD